MSKPKIITVVAGLVLACGAVSAQQFWSHRIGIEVDVPYGDDPNQVADIYTQGQRSANTPGFVASAVPPIITIHGTADSTVPYSQAQALHAALTTRNRLVTLEGGTHGGFSDSQYQQAMAAIFEFLANVGE